MKKFLLSILAPLVDAPSDLRVTEVNGSQTTLFELRCGREDIGKVIGKNGKTVAAVRTLLSTFAARQGRKAVLEVVE